MPARRTLLLQEQGVTLIATKISRRGQRRARWDLIRYTIPGARQSYYLVVSWTQGRLQAEEHFHTRGEALAQFRCCGAWPAGWQGPQALR